MFFEIMSVLTVAINKFVALYPTFKELKGISMDEFPELESFL